jgi:hypothetical protein
MTGTRWRAVLAVALVTIAAGTAGAADKNPAASKAAADAVAAKRYADCLRLAKTKPTDGWETALAWAGEGGGEPARHCEAVALIGLKQYREAAQRLEDLAKQSGDAPQIRAGMLAQAGQAWILNGDPGRAYADQTAALKLTPAQADLLIDRAESSALGQNWRDALVDLDQAIGLAPDRAEAYAYRAAARRELKDLKGAAADAQRATELDPDSVPGWLESGNAARLLNDNAAARKAWMRVIALAPQSRAAEDARANLEQLDVKP